MVKRKEVLIMLNLVIAMFPVAIIFGICGVIAGIVEYFYKHNRYVWAFFEAIYRTLRNWEF